MGTQDRKERERMRREKMMLQAARRILNKKGYLGLNMDQIAAEIEYSKGIVYQHFTSKEDLLTGIAADLIEDAVAPLRTVAASPAPAREVMTAALMAAERFFLERPEYLRIREILSVPSLGEKAKPERQTRMAGLDAELASLLLEIVQRGMAEGTLSFALPENGARVALGAWALLWGSVTLEDDAPGRAPFAGIGVEPAFQANLQAYLDGLGWRPLSGEVDYAAAGRRLLASTANSKT